MGPPFLVGDRVYLREVRVEDVNDNYYRWMNDLEVTQFLESRFYPSSVQSLQEYVKNKTNARDTVFLAIILKGANRHIGNIKLGPINWIHRLADVGILVGEKQYWGKGYGTEALSLLTRYAFKSINLHKLTAGCYAPNKASTAIFLKNGFQIEGEQKKQCFYNGGYVDVVLLGLLNPGS